MKSKMILPINNQFALILHEVGVGMEDLADSPMSGLTEKRQRLQMWVQVAIRKSTFLLDFNK